MIQLFLREAIDSLRRWKFCVDVKMIADDELFHGSLEMKKKTNEMENCKVIVVETISLVARNTKCFREKRRGEVIRKKANSSFGRAPKNMKQMVRTKSAVSVTDVVELLRLTLDTKSDHFLLDFSSAFPEHFALLWKMFQFFTSFFIARAFSLPWCGFNTQIDVHTADTFICFLIELLSSINARCAATRSSIIYSSSFNFFPSLRCRNFYWFWWMIFMLCCSLDAWKNPNARQSKTRKNS